jgi:hypothetical protein
VPGTGGGVPRGDLNVPPVRVPNVSVGVSSASGVVRLVRLVGWSVDPRVELLIRDGRRHTWSSGGSTASASSGASPLP